jgi:hypothetical protein
VGSQVVKLETATAKNAEQISQTSTNIQLMVAEVGRIKKDTESLDGSQRSQEKKVSELSKRFSNFSTLVYIFWAILLLVLGAYLKKFIP